MTSVLSKMGGERVLVGEMAWMTVPRRPRSVLSGRASFGYSALASEEKASEK